MSPARGTDAPATLRVRRTALGQGRPKIIVPLTAATAAELVEEARALRGHPVNLVEWRADALRGPGGADPDDAALVEAGRRLRQVVEEPLLVTVRTSREGGGRDLDAPAYARLLGAVLAAGIADLLDVEMLWDEPAARSIVAESHAAGVPVIGSHHDHTATPPAHELARRLRRIRELGADIPKLAVTPRDADDVLALLQATRGISREADHPVITMGMGDLGVVTRVAGEVFGSAATFGTVGRASAPGQIPAEELRRVLDVLGADRQRD